MDYETILDNVLHKFIIVIAIIYMSMTFSDSMTRYRVAVLESKVDYLHIEK